MSPPTKGTIVANSDSCNNGNAIYISTSCSNSHLQTPNTRGDDGAAERHRMGFYLNYDEPFTRGHKCKHLFDITLVNDYDFDDTDASLVMMIGA